MRKEEIKKLIHDLFRVGDSWVNIEYFVRFEDDFSKVTKKYGFDLHKIYYGKSFTEMKKIYARYKVLEKIRRKKI